MRGFSRSAHSRREAQGFEPRRLWLRAGPGSLPSQGTVLALMSVLYISPSRSHFQSAQRLKVVLLSSIKFLSSRLKKQSRGEVKWLVQGHTGRCPIEPRPCSNFGLVPGREPTPLIPRTASPHASFPRRPVSLGFLAAESCQDDSPLQKMEFIPLVLLPSLRSDAGKVQGSSRSSEVISGCESEPDSGWEDPLPGPNLSVGRRKQGS